MIRQVIMIFLLIGSFSLHANETDLKFYRPYGGSDDQSSVVIKETLQGNCWQQSKRIKREDAWRCVAGTKTYDPCFIKQYSTHKEAICTQSPWSSESVQINLPESVDSSHHTPLDVSQAYPWAIELTSGEKCQVVDAGKVHEGLPIRYQCDNQNVLFGHLQRCKATWTILERKGDGKVETVAVSKAWF